MVLVEGVKENSDLVEDEDCGESTTKVPRVCPRTCCLRWMLNRMGGGGIQTGEMRSHRASSDGEK